MTQLRARKSLHRSPLTIAPGQASAQVVTGRLRTPASPHVPRYSLLRWRDSRAQKFVTRLALVTGSGLVAFYYVWYQRSSDASPDSIYGYAFAIAGTLLLLLVGIGYVIRKRWHRQWSRRLHTILAWHMGAGLLGLLLIFLHAGGNYNPRTGTYALYGLIALIASGVIGRVLDRVGPLFAARAARQVLTSKGEERLDDLERQLQAMRTPKHGCGPRRSPTRMAGIPWDIGYYDLDPKIEMIPALVGLSADQAADAPATGGRGLSQREVKREVRAIEAAMSREQFYIQLVRTWRHLHILISLVFLGLLIWHLVYAATLLVNAW